MNVDGCSSLCSLARISHRVSSRSRRGAVLSGVFDLRGAERVLAVRRAPRGEKTPLGAMHRRSQQEAGEICGLDLSPLRGSYHQRSPGPWGSRPRLCIYRPSRAPAKKKPDETAGSSQRKTPPPSLRSSHYIRKFKKSRKIVRYEVSVKSS